MDQTIQETEVFVAGGGPAGLAAALAARQAGFDVIVVDRGHPPIDKACGEGIMPDGLAALRRLGVCLDSPQGTSFAGIRFINGAQEVQASFHNGTGFGIRRTALASGTGERCDTCWSTTVVGPPGDQDLRIDACWSTARPFAAVG